MFVTTAFEHFVADVRFCPDDQARLGEAYRSLAPHLPAIAAELHEGLEAQPTMLVGRAPSDRVAALIQWMSGGLRGPWSETFFEQRCQRGRSHADLGLPQHDIVTTMAIVRSAYIERLAVLYAPQTAFAMIGSANKLLDLELAIMLHGYQLALEAQRAVREQRDRHAQFAAMQTLSSGLAHELRNPLNSARLQLEVLERRIRRQMAASELAAPCEHAEHELERLSALVDDFLAFAHPPALAATIQDVVTLVEGALEVERPLADRLGIELELVVTRLPIQAPVDPAKVQQVVQNLVRNALEAGSRGGHVQVRISAEGDQVHLRVDDDGPGIPERVRARMFEPFFSTKESGTGLGMSIVRSLVSMHGGTIDIRSTPAGTHVDVAFPRGA